MMLRLVFTKKQRSIQGKFQSLLCKISLILTFSTPSIMERANRALIPQKIAPAFNVVPVSGYSMTNSTPGSNSNGAKSGKYRKLKSTMKMMGRK